MALSDRIPVPPRDSINTGLNAVTEAFMKEKLGIPGHLTANCSEPTGSFRHRIVEGVSIAPRVRVSGLKEAVESLQEIFDEVKRDRPDVFEQVRTEGMLCVRHRRTNPNRFSNHSWGAAIDLFFGSGVVDQGEPVTHRGNLVLYPFFHRHGWYWGAEFPGDSVDSMHFELSREAVSHL